MPEARAKPIKQKVVAVTDTTARRGPVPTPAQVASRVPQGVQEVADVTGAQSLVLALEAVGVDTVFGIPGGAILPAYDPLLDSVKVRHILVRHEQGAGHAAQGYAAATGKVGVCMATSGPGATNLVTPIADAYMDSVPMVAITGQVNSSVIGTDAFQEADIRGITMPITKHNYLVTDAAEIPRAIAEAFHVASSGRPGPVLVDITKDALTGKTTFHWPPVVDLPGYRPVTKPHHKQIRAAVELIRAAKKPVFYVGGGVIRAGAAQQLRELVELTGIPLVTTLMARGAVPDSHELHLGMPGMHGSVSAVTALQKSDLLITLGARFDDRVTGHLESFAPEAKVIHADIDPAEISKNRVADVPIVGDCKEVIGDLLETLRQVDGPIGDYRRGASAPPRGSRSSRSATSSRRRKAPSPRSSCSNASVRSPARTPRTSRVSASTRCGPRSSCSTSAPTPGSTPVASARWASRCRRPWAPRLPNPSAPCGPSTATAASR